MKIRQISVCDTCRKRKLGCDGRTPACTQCTHHHLQCPGYNLDLIFRPVEVFSISSGTKNPANRRKKLKKCKQAVRAETHAVIQRPPLDRPLTWPLCNIVALCVQNLAPTGNMFLETASAGQMCCSWMEVLPELVGGEYANDDLLPSSVRALAASVVARGATDLAFASSALEAQSCAMRAMNRAVNRALGRRGAALCDEFAVAVMCLLLSEILISTSSSNISIHVNGMASLIQHCTPSFYATGIPHRIFTSVRSILIINSLLNRTPTFLSTSPWKTEPFRLTPASPFQILISEASEIPSILATIDSITNNPPRLTDSLATRVIERLTSVLERLKQWFENLQTTTPEPLSWQKKRPTGEISLWFPDFVVGTSVVHCWAFWLVCVTQIQKLREMFPGIEDEGIWVGGQLVSMESEHVVNAIVEKGTWILRSLEFFVQDEMKLVGVAEVSFPFHVAIDVLGGLGNGNEGPSEVKVVDVREKISRNIFREVLGFWIPEMVM